MKNFAKKQSTRDIFGGIIGMIFFLALAAGGITSILINVFNCTAPIILTQLSQWLVQLPADLIFNSLALIATVPAIVHTILYGIITLYAIVGIAFAAGAFETRDNGQAIYVCCYAILTAIAALISMLAIDKCFILVTPAVAIIVTLILIKRK